MLEDYAKTKKCSYQKAISALVSEGLNHELMNLKAVPDKVRKELISVLSLKQTEFELYQNAFNILFVQEEDLELFSPFLQDKDLKLRLEIPEMNVNMWVYSIIDNILLKNILQPD